jgi:hypothetical protein
MFVLYLPSRGCIVGLEPIQRIVLAWGTFLVFLIGLAVIVFLLLRRVIRAYVGDQGVDLPATLALCLIAIVLVVCVGATWVAFHAPD